MQNKIVVFLFAVIIMFLIYHGFVKGSADPPELMEDYPTHQQLENYFEERVRVFAFDIYDPVFYNPKRSDDVIHEGEKPDFYYIDPYTEREIEVYLRAKAIRNMLDALSDREFEGIQTAKGYIYVRDFFEDCTNRVLRQFYIATKNNRVLIINNKKELEEFAREVREDYEKLVIFNE